MGKKNKKKIRRKAEQQRPPENISPVEQKKSPLWQGLVISLVSIIFFLGLFEGVLTLFGVEPELSKKDPFVGFASNVPLFVKTTGAAGREDMVTASNKYNFFNRQQFPMKKSPRTYRIFCLGGSTTYGRPYNDTTSFAGWLRELLPVADSTKRWEVINAGGISYAGYRVAQLMEELVNYEPDLFIIYTGHNEFLEERTYGKMRDIPAAVRTTAELLSHTRTWSAMSTALNQMGAFSQKKQDERFKLTDEVNTKLDRSAGPKRYKRDDVLRDRILQHYRISLARMVDIARTAGADLLFVTPASNLKDSSPFKSQHTDGIIEADLLRSRELSSTAQELIQNSKWREGLDALNEATAVDPGFAEHHYRRGKILFALGKYDEADKAFRRARDEDVCPLRALSPMNEIVAEVAREKSVTLVDFIDFLKQRVQSEYGHAILGEKYFLDHVHPTIEGHRLLAVELIDAMVGEGLVTPAQTWGKQAIAEVAARVEGGLNKEEHAKALLTLVRVMDWAGKFDDAFRLADQVFNSGTKDPELLKESSAFMASISYRRREGKSSMQYFQKALELDPKNPVIHLQLGLMLLKEPFKDFEVAGAHLLFSTIFMSNKDVTHLNFGRAMINRERYFLAYPSIRQAVLLYPKSKGKALLEFMQEDLPSDRLDPTPAGVKTEKYQSGALSRIVQVRPDAKGREIPDGIWTEWHENGMLKSFIDYENGVRHGIEMKWNTDGNITSRARYLRGKLAEDIGNE